MSWINEKQNIYSVESDDLCTKLYFTTSSEKEKYKNPIKPMLYVKSIIKPGEIQLTQQLEINNTFLTIKHLKLRYERLNYEWRHDYNLFEVLYDEVKFYLDIEYEYLSEEHNKLILDTILKLLSSVLKVPIVYDNLAISYGKGEIIDKDTNKKFIKSSYHIIINNDYKVKNNKELNDIKDVLDEKIKHCNEYEILRNGLKNKYVIDFNVYHNNQQFKLPNQTKLFNKKYGFVLQKVISNKNKLEHFLIKNVKNQSLYYDVKEITKTYFKEKKTKSNKTVICCDGYLLNIPYDYKNKLELYKNCFDTKFKLDIESIENDYNNDKLLYYINSIPNNKKVSKDIFLIMSYCIKTIENLEKRKDGLFILTRWTKQYDDNITQLKLSDFYKNLSIKGFGYNTLYYFARLYNNLVDKFDELNILFDDKPKAQFIKLGLGGKMINEKWKTISINNKYVSKGLQDIKSNIINLYNDNDIIFIKSELGTGKTRLIIDILKQLDENETVCFLSCKRSFAGSIEKDLFEFKFVNYLNVKTNEIRHTNRIICSLESAKYLNLSYDVLIADEINTIISNLTSETNKTNDPIKNIDMFYSLIQSSKKCIFMDAHLRSNSFNLVRDIIKSNLHKKRLLYIKNEFKPPLRRCNMKTGDKDTLYDFLTFNMLKRLKKGEKIVFVCGSNQLIQTKFRQCC